MSGSSDTRKTPKVPEQIEARPHGWKRFEKAVDAAVKSDPRHRPGKTAAAKAKPKRVASARMTRGFPNQKATGWISNANSGNRTIPIGRDR
jgi:hypothetical protein